MPLQRERRFFVLGADPELGRRLHAGLPATPPIRRATAAASYRSGHAPCKFRMKGASTECARCRGSSADQPGPATLELKTISSRRRAVSCGERLRLVARAAQPVEQPAELAWHRHPTISSRRAFRSRRNRRSTSSSAARGRLSVISTNWPRLSILHSRRAASPSSTSRSISREVEYCGISICFSSSTGRISPRRRARQFEQRIIPGERREAGLLQILLDGVEHPALDPHQADPGCGRLGRWFAFHDAIPGFIRGRPHRLHRTVRVELYWQGCGEMGNSGRPL